MTRREFINRLLLSAGAVPLLGLAAGCRSAGKKDGEDMAKRKSSAAELAEDVRARLAQTEKTLADHPNAARKVKDYLAELRDKTDASRSRTWLEYQNDRLRQIAWLADPTDDGRASGMRLRMRPYDIPWLIWGIGQTATPEKAEAFAKKSTNGVSENVDKVLNAPEVEIVFTDRFADFCYLCVSLDTEGCKAHKEFAGYGTTFPQAVQMSPRLRGDSDLALQILGLKWTDVATARQLLKLCVGKAPDPAAFEKFPLSKKNWPSYRAGIARIKMLFSAPGAPFAQDLG